MTKKLNGYDLFLHETGEQIRKKCCKYNSRSVYFSNCEGKKYFSVSLNSETTTSNCLESNNHIIFMQENITRNYLLN